VETGGVELARELYTDGYDRIRAAYPEAAAIGDTMQQKTAAAV
jgi:Fe-S cluster assembly ATP-binding protein